jgi:hypothetical protein
MKEEVVKGNKKEEFLLRFDLSLAYYPRSLLLNKD